MDHTTLKLLHAALGALNQKELSQLTATTAVGASIEDYSSKSNSQHEVAHDLVKWCRSRGRIPALVEALLEGEFREGEAVRRLREHLSAHPDALRERWQDDVAGLHWGWKVAIGAACVLTLCGGGLLGRRAWLRRHPWTCTATRRPLRLPSRQPVDDACPGRMRAVAIYDLSIVRRTEGTGSTVLTMEYGLDQAVTMEPLNRASPDRCVQVVEEPRASFPLHPECFTHGQREELGLRAVVCSEKSGSQAELVPVFHVERAGHPTQELRCNLTSSTPSEYVGGGR